MPFPLVAGTAASMADFWKLRMEAQPESTDIVEIEQRLLEEKKNLARKLKELERHYGGNTTREEFEADSHIARALAEYAESASEAEALEERHIRDIEHEEPDAILGERFKIPEDYIESLHINEDWERAVMELNEVVDERHGFAEKQSEEKQTSEEWAAASRELNEFRRNSNHLGEDNTPLGNRRR